MLLFKEGVPKVKYRVVCSAILFVFIGCSSAPKGTLEVRSQRRMGLSQLEAAHRETDRGNYETALGLNSEAQRFAVRADDPALLIRTALSRGDILSWLDRPAEAQAAFDGALGEAERIGNAELAAVSRVYIARNRLRGGGDAMELREEVRSALSLIKEDPADLALGWTVMGLAEKELGNWNEAEKGIKNALDIHVKGGYLERAAYDWYLIASIRSVSGDYQGALDALEEALSYDRRAENTYGLATDWRATGDVYKKAGKGPAADIAYRRSADIFRSINMEKEAAAVEGKIGP
jgi:tetratricopeptide (TPR) repeat protein